MISSVDSLSNTTNPPTSQKIISEESTKNIEIVNKIINQETETTVVEPKTEVLTNKTKTHIDNTNPKITQEPLSSFENIIKIPGSELDNKETSSAFDAQTKLTQSISSVLRVQQQSDCKMKDINLNSKATGM